MATPTLEILSSWPRSSDGWDAVVLIGEVSDGPPELARALAAARAIDAQAGHAVIVIPAVDLPGGRVIWSPTGPLGRDHDDVRAFGDAARKAAARARDAGARRLVVIVGGAGDGGAERYRLAAEVAVLELMAGLWAPLEAREARGEAVVEPVAAIGVIAPWLDGPRLAALEGGRRAARDVAGTEPERMSPARIVEYARALFAGTAVEVQVIEERAAIAAGYPLIDAVARASYAVARHAPRILRLELRGAGEVTRTHLFAGKGLVYDTGGADLKTDGHMAGMSRDKGGAAAVLGLFAAAARRAPVGVRLVAELGLVRNSIGPDAFVSDEIITSHAGVRVRIGNTDAEGRLVLADLLSHLREDALASPIPSLYSVATLTGHAYRAMGPYSIAICNGPGRAAGLDRALATHGEAWGEPFEVSQLRREDVAFVAPRSAADEVLSCNNAASSATARGHQFPAAFLGIASGLAGHGGDSARPLPYAHVDIGGSAVEDGDWQHGRPTAAPVVALAAALGVV
jgi:leucyl aminopeptidase